MKRKVAVILLLVCLFAGQGLATTSQQPVNVYYSYGPDGPVVFSQNNIEVRIGQKLILLPAPDSLETPKNVRFMTTGGVNNFYDLFESSDDFKGANPRIEGIFVIAKKAGTGKLEVVPNYSDWNKARVLTVTVIE